MKRIFFLAMIALAFQSHAQQFPYEINYSCSLPPMRLSLDMYVEDIKTNTYVLDWEYYEGEQNDSIRELNKSKLEDCGLYFLITESKQNLGRYNGLSTPMSFCYFIPTEESITLYFELGANFDYANCDCMYRKISLPVINHFKADVILYPDTTVRYLQYMTKGLSSIMISDPMPGGYRADKFIPYMYYLNIHNGKIHSGKFLLNNFSVQYLCTHIGYYRIIDPFATYYTKTNQSFKGYNLIQMKKVSETEFDFEKAFELSDNFWSY